MRRFRIRRCNGNKEAWLLVALCNDGSESEAHGSYTTALSLDALVTYEGWLQPGDVVEFRP